MGEALISGSSYTLGMTQIHLVSLDEAPIPTAKVHDVQRQWIEYFRHHREPRDVAGVIYAFEFEPTITYGHRLKNNVLRPEFADTVDDLGSLTDALAAEQLAFYESPRGGGATYLGPGQRSYFLNIDLREVFDEDRPSGFDRALRAGLAAVVRDHLDEEPVLPNRVDLGVVRHGQVHKLGSSGVRVASYERNGPRRMMTHYGASLHVEERGLDGFEYIHACGLDPCEYPVASLERFGATPTYAQVDASFAHAIAASMGAQLVMPDDPRNIFQVPMSRAFYGSSAPSSQLREE